MKSIALTLATVVVAGAILCLCAYGYIYYWHTTVLESRDTIQLKAVWLHSSDPALRISGLSGHSALAVKKITTEREDSSIVVLVHLDLAKGKRSGSFEYDVPIPDSVNQIRFGKDKALLWKRESRS